MPNISVIIPNYNNSKYLRACLDSVVNQSFRDIEIIVIDDCSTDDSANVISKYATLDNRVKYHKMPRNSGVGAVRNYGIEAAVGEYLFFLDSDDIMAPGALQAMIECAQQTGVDVVSGERIRVAEDFVMPVAGTDKKIGRFQFALFHKYTDLVKSLEEQYRGNVSSKLFRREILDGIRFDERLHPYEDTEFVLRLYPLVRTAAIQNIIALYYRRSETSIMCNDSVDASPHVIIAMNGVQKFLLENWDDIAPDYIDFVNNHNYEFIRLFIVKTYLKYQNTACKSAKGQLKLQIKNVAAFAQNKMMRQSWKNMHVSLRERAGFMLSEWGLVRTGGRMLYRKKYDQVGDIKSWRWFH